MIWFDKCAACKIAFKSRKYQAVWTTKLQQRNAHHAITTSGTRTQIFTFRLPTYTVEPPAINQKKQIMDLNPPKFKFHGLMFCSYACSTCGFLKFVYFSVKAGCTHVYYRVFTSIFGFVITECFFAPVFSH